MRFRSDLRRSQTPQNFAQRLFLGLALMLAICAAPLGAASAQEGLIQRLEDLASRFEKLASESADREAQQEESLAALRSKIAALDQTLKTQQEQEIERMGHLLCGSINADASIARKAWSYGRAHRMTSPTTCAALCGNGKEPPTNACEGLVLINGDKQHVTGHHCGYQPGRVSTDTSEYVFCCCRQ